MRYLFLAFLACAKLLASYEGSSASQLASIEAEPSALICGCIHAVTGDFLFQQPDMVVKGAQNLVIPRKYFSSARDAPIEEQILPYRTAVGWGVVDLIHLTRLAVPEPNGMVFTYGECAAYTYRPVAASFCAGITGYCTDYLGNRYHPANNRAYWPNDVTLLVQTSSGEVRVYEKEKFSNNPPECRIVFRLCRIRLSNGIFIDYEYKRKKLRRIKAFAGGGVFSEIEFAKREKNRIHLKGSDQSELEYEYRDYKRKISGTKRRATLLKCAASSLYPEERLNREENSIRIRARHFGNGRSLFCSYDREGRASVLKGPQGLLAKVSYEEGKTTALDRDGNKTVYLYNPKTLRIEEIQFFQGCDELLKLESYTWTPFGCLEKKTISGKGEPLLTIHYRYNDRLDLSQKTIGKDSAAYTDTYHYNERHLLSEKRESNGKRTTYTYLEAATLPKEICTYHEDQLLKRTRYLYDENLLLVSETLDDGTTHFQKKIQRKQTPPFYGMPETMSEHCNNQLIKKTKHIYDRFGNITKTETYGSDHKFARATQTICNEKNQITAEIDPAGHSTRFHYDGNGNLTRKYTPLGLEIRYIYDGANRLIEERQIGKDQTLTTHYRSFDALDQPTTTIDPLGGITRRKYDALGNLIQETNPQGHTTHYSYDALGNTTSIIDPHGNTTKTSYNHLGSPLRITHPDGSTETYTYNPDGTKASHTDRAGTTTHYSYDHSGNLTSEAILGGPSKSWTYDSFHLLEETSRDSHTTTYSYDKAGRLIEKNDKGKITTYTYDNLSRIATEQTGPQQIHYTYDPLDRITSETTYEDHQPIHKTQTSYNAEGSPLCVTHYPHNQPETTSYTYDRFGRETSRTTPLGHTTTTTYQFEKDKKTITTREPGGIIQIDTYNPLDQLILQERPLTQTSYTYDPCGDLIKQITNSHTIEWTYDPCHRKLTETESGQKTTHYTYYPDGKLKTLTKPDGTRLDHAYNTLGHLCNLQSSRGDIHYSYTYNNCGHLLLAKDLIHNTQTKRIVDPHGNILEETLANNLQLKNSYDQLGRRTTLTLPSGKTITYTYTGTNLAAVTIDDQTHSYTHDLSSNLLEETHIDGTKTHYTYDQDQRLTSRKHPHLEEILEYDLRGNLTKLTQNQTPHTYSYDPSDQLIEEPGHRYSYDPLHNRTQKNKKTTTYNPLNQETHLNYNPSGNRLSTDSHTLEYDTLGRLTKAKNWFTTTYTYDPLNRRILENSTPILWDGQHELGPESNQRILGRTPHAEIGSTIAVLQGNRLLCPLHNARGDLIALNSKTQTFTAFGEGKAHIRWGYRSKVHDGTGLIYFGRRYYDPKQGRFITPDPEGYLDGANLYAYTLNNPLTHHDPYGLYIYLNKDHFKEMAIGFYHGSLSYARDTALFAGKYLGGIHGPDDMSFSDIYSAHLDANDRFVKKTDDWMASSPHASGDLYHFTRGATYTGMDLAGGFLFPFGQMKTAASAGRTILRAEKIAHSSPTLLKTSLVTGKLFKSNKHSSRLKDTVKPIWTSTKQRSSVGNAYWHWKDHQGDFLGIKNSKQYVEATHNFIRNPPPGTLTKTRVNGDVIFYHPASNIFAITNKLGVPRTMYKPSIKKHPYSTNLEYFNAQK